MTTDVYTLEARNLTHGYGDRIILNSVDIRLCRGEFFGFLGQNGAGKSTAIRSLCGFLKPQKGEIRVAGVDVIKDPTTAQRLIGVLSEDVGLYEALTGAEFLTFAGQMHGLTEAEATKRAYDLMERLELARAAGQTINTYSLGMKKKIALAAALIHAPRILFLDEPFNGVDAAATQTICRLLTQLSRDSGVTIFFTSHILEMVERLCDRVAILHGGRIRREGTVAELKAEAEAQNMPLEEMFLHLTGTVSKPDVPLEWFA